MTKKTSKATVLSKQVLTYIINNFEVPCTRYILSYGKYIENRPWCEDSKPEQASSFVDFKRMFQFKPISEAI